MKRLLRSGGAAILCLLATTGCLFNVKHELPANSYFGKLPERNGALGKAFEDGGRKNWALAGLVSYSGWSSGDVLEQQAGTTSGHVENLAIETTFDTIDTVVWVFPGFLYGYYIWAPRTVRVEGTQVRDR